MSKVCSRIRSILKTKKVEANPSSSPKITPLPNKPISIKDLANEPNLETLANNLKQAAIHSHKFRNRHNIYDYTISRLTLNKRFNLIEDVLEKHKEFEEITHEGFAVRLMSLYARAGMFDHARKVFDEMPERKCVRTVKSVNALLKAGVEGRRFDDVFRIWREVFNELGIDGDVVSWNIVVHACCEKGELDEGLLMVEEMMGKGVSPSVVTFNTVLDAFYRERGVEGGEMIWGMFDEYNVVRDVRSYNLKMEALIKEGEIEKAVGLFEGLESVGLKPDLTSYNLLIRKCCDQGDVGEAKKWYNVLVESGATPNSFTFSLLVPELCGSGDFELAFELCKKMFKRQFVVDEALLQLVVNKLVEDSMTEEAEELVKLGKSNIYFQYNLELPSDNTGEQECNH